MIRKHYSKYKVLCEKYDTQPRWRDFAYLTYQKFHSGVSIEDFCREKLWDRSIDHSAYYNSLHKVIHRWSNVHKHFYPNAGKWWLLVHWIDYMYSKLRYLGLDAMDYFKYEFYHFKAAKRKTFITEGFLTQMDRHFNDGKKNSDYTRILSDKLLFNEYFSEYISRQWISSKNLSQEALLDFVKDKQRIIVKPQHGVQGGGIFMANVNTEKEVNELYNKVKDGDYLMEEVLVQCDALNNINPSSVNTIRIYSVLHENEIHITGATLRIGRGGSVIDNYSNGGLASEICTEHGIVKTHAVSQDGGKFYIHPDSQQIIIGLQIPFWQAIKQQVKKAHLTLPQLRYIAWDTVVCKNGSIAFIEANTCGGVELQQQPGLEGKKPVYMKYW